MNVTHGLIRVWERAMEPAAAGLVLLLICAPLLIGEPYTVTRFSGDAGGPGYADGEGEAPRFVNPADVATDAAGNVYVVDEALHTIRKVSPAGEMTTLAGLAGVPGSANGRGGEARFGYPRGVATDSSGNVYVADTGNSAVRKISPQGVVTTLASVSFPESIAVDPQGNVLVISYSAGQWRVVKITPLGEESVLSGASSSLKLSAVETDSSGEVYLCCFNGAVRKITDTGATTDYFHPYGSGRGLAVDRDGTLYMSILSRIDELRPDGTWVALAGDIGLSGVEDGTGDSARFLFPRGLAVTQDGLLYVAEPVSHTVRRIVLQSTAVSTFAGVANLYGGHVDGAIESAEYSHPSDTAVDSANNIFVADQFNRVIRKITPAGVVSTIAGSARLFGSDDGLGPNARFFQPKSIAIDASDHIYVADIEAHTIRKISPGGMVTSFAGQSGSSGLLNGTDTEAKFSQPSGLAIDGAGNVYVADTGNGLIRKITPAGIVTTYAGGSPPFYFSRPAGIAFDGSDLFVADAGVIYKLTVPDAQISVLAGKAGVFSTLDGTGGAARFSGPVDIAAAGPGNLFVVEEFALRHVTGAGVVTTVAGAHRAANVDGTGSIAGFVRAGGLSSDGEGNLLIADPYANNIRLARPPGIDDAAVVSDATPETGAMIQLDTSVGSATSWEWTVIRRPAGSVAQLSSPSVANPTFIPDIADLFRIQLRAEGPGGIRYSTVDVAPTGGCVPLASVVASIEGSAEVCPMGVGGLASVVVTGGGGVSYQWGWRLKSGDPITPIAGATSSDYQITAADLGGSGLKQLVVTVTSSCGFSLISNSLTVDVLSQPDSTISAGSGVYANESHNFASVAPESGASYAWSITNGTIVSGVLTDRITFTAGASGEVLLEVTVEIDGCVSSSQQAVPILSRPAGASLFYLVSPCRVIDSRNGTGAIGSSTTRSIVVAGVCGIPAGATSVALNITAIAPSAPGYLALYPAHLGWSGTSTLNYQTGKVRANNAVVALAPDGSLVVRNAGATTHFVIDVTGYFR